MSCQECAQYFYHLPNWNRVVSDSLGLSLSVLPAAMSGQPPNVVASVSPGPRLKAVIVW